MSRRVIDVAIRSEIKKGFGDVARQLAALEKSLSKISGLQASINKLANQFERSNNFKAAAAGVTKLGTAQKGVNKTYADGIRIAKQYESAHTSLGAKVGSLAAAQKAGSISRKQRLEAEIGLLSEYVKKTNDLSVLNSKTNSLRGSNGRFVQFTAPALKAVSDSFNETIATGMDRGARTGSLKLVTRIKDQSGRIKEAISNIMGNAPISDAARKKLQANYEQIFQAYSPQKVSRSIKPGAGLSTSALINKTTGVDRGLDPRFEMLKEQYRRAEERAAYTSRRIQHMRFGPNPAQSNPGFKHLFDQYNKLGHFLFQLQYSTLTLFGLSGIGMIMAQADAYTTLQNQVARTSTNITELGDNMKDVFAISMQTFSDPKSVGKIFSTINKYSKALELSREQVSNVTGGIAGAFAASPGNAEEKSASQYQFMQAIQSNKLGGDELRSVLEMAPYVGDILAKGIAKNRGMPEGSVIDLRAEKGKVDAREIVKVFNDPAIQAEIRKTLGNQARTFGDLLMVGKTRLMQLTAEFGKSTGVFSAVINGIARLIGSDESFNKFVNALQAATTALVIYGAMIGVQGAAGIARNAAGVVGARMGFGSVAGTGRLVVNDAQKVGERVFGQDMSRRSYNRMYNAARFDNVVRSVDTGMAAAGAIGPAALRGARAAGGAIKGGIATAATASVTALSAAMAAMKPSVTSVTGATKTLGSAFKGVFNVFATVCRGLSMVVTDPKKAFTGLMGIFKAGGPILRSVLIGVGSLFTGVSALAIPLIVIAAVIALVALRFNKLLGGMTGGMNIMDILTGLWYKLQKGMSDFAAKVKNSFLGDMWSGFTGWLDGVLKLLGKTIAADPQMQRAQLERQYGLTDANVYRAGAAGTVGLATVEGMSTDGKKIKGTAKTGGMQGSQWMTNESGDLAVYNNGKLEGYIQKGGTGGLPSGQQTNLPSGTPTEPANKREDPWNEFIRDMRLRVQSAVDLFNVAPQNKEIQGEQNENLRKAMDTANFDSSAFETLGSAWAAFSAQNLVRAKEVEEWNAKLKANRLLEATQEFIEGIRDWLGEGVLAAKQAGMKGFKKNELDDRLELIKRYVNSPEFGAGKSQLDIKAAREGALFDINNGNFDAAQASVRENLTPDQAGAFDLDLVSAYSNRVDAITNSMKLQNQMTRDRLRDQAAALGFYGRERDLQAEILDATRAFTDEHGIEALQNEKISAQLKEQIELIRKKAEIENKYRSSYGNGIKEALGEYGDGLDDLAGQTKDIFGSALKGIEDGLTSLITTGKMNLLDFITQMHQDISRLFVRTFIMKPITNWMEGMANKLFPTAATDQTITANNVYINSTPLSSILGQGLGGANSPLDTMTKALGLGDQAGTGMFSHGTNPSMDIFKILGNNPSMGTQTPTAPVEAATTIASEIAKVFQPGGGFMSGLMNLFTGLTGSLGGIFSQLMGSLGGGLGGAVSGGMGMLGKGLGMAASLLPPPGRSPSVE